MNKKGVELPINTLLVFIILISLLLVSIFIVLQLSQGGRDILTKLLEKIKFGR
ncbi:hypothetical protein HYY72_05030 [Candidatus Woesearchaeota archaeon]|nr:hypothetical protein [Candidatus Woesearchaeota archaeon]